MAATARIAAAAPIIPSYSTGGTPYIIHGFLGPYESAAQTASRSVYEFCMAQIHKQNTLRKTSAAIA